jgi:hypothetical protein
MGKILNKPSSDSSLKFTQLSLDPKFLCILAPPYIDFIGSTSSNDFIEAVELYCVNIPFCEECSHNEALYRFFKLIRFYGNGNLFLLEIEDFRVVGKVRYCMGGH